MRYELRDRERRNVKAQIDRAVSAFHEDIDRIFGKKQPPSSRE
jgi:hypothetical protein